MVVACGVVAVGVPYVVQRIVGIDDGVKAVVGVVVVDSLVGIGQYLCGMLGHIARTVVDVDVGARVRMNTLNHSSQHVVSVICGVLTRVGALQQLPQRVVSEGGHCAQRGNGLNPLSASAGQHRYGNAVGVCGCGAEVGLPVVQTESV